MSMRKENTTYQHEQHHNAMYPCLEELIEARYIELFGREYLDEDAPFIEEVKPQTTVERLNYTKTNAITFNMKYNKAMAEYQRYKKAEIIRYNLGPDLSIPSSVICYDKTLVQKTTVHEEITTIKSEDPIQSEEVLDICIQPTKRAEIETAAASLHGMTALAISNNKRKKEMWKYQRNLKHKLKHNLCQ